MAVTIHPIAHPPGSKVSFGAEVRGADLETLSDDAFATIRTALYTHHVLLFKHQSTLSPRAQYLLTRRFDPLADSYGHGTTHNSSATSILHPDLKTMRDQSQVQVIGNGPVLASEQGLSEDAILRHPHHRTFHRDPIPADSPDDRANTRFYRWHIDAALYGLHPPMATTLLAVRVPRADRQTLRYDDGSGDELHGVARGATAFASGEAMYDLLSEADKELARTTRVQYAPHPYVWMARARSRPDGLGLFSEGRELSRAELPGVEEEKIQILPMCWRNPVTGKLALQVHPSAVEKLHLGDGSVVEDLERVREVVHRLQRPGIAPERVWAVDWEEGDLVVFNNRGLIHSVTGSFWPEEVRVFRQCNLAATAAPEGPEGEGQ